MSQHWTETEKGKQLIESAFKAANLPEVQENELETGTYTNMQIAKMFDDPAELISLLMALPKGGGNASRRSILSFAVEMR
ncbi:MAG: hypothetical protein ACOZAO_00685 [Patescibacteria group bacterium]